MIDKKTTIQVTQSTKEALASFGSKGDSFEDIIKRLISFYKKNNRL